MEMFPRYYPWVLRMCMFLCGILVCNGLTRDVLVHRRFCWHGKWNEMLAGGLEHFDDLLFYFSISWECHHPNWLSYFPEGWRKTTNQNGFVPWLSLQCVPGSSKTYHLVMTKWHSQFAMDRSTMLLRTVNHLFRLGPSKNHGELLVITRGYLIFGGMNIHLPLIWDSPEVLTCFDPRPMGNPVMRILGTFWTPLKKIAMYFHGIPIVFQ